MQAVRMASRFLGIPGGRPARFPAGIVGNDLIKKTFWFFATIFIFICFTNWFGLLPGVGTIGWGVQTARGFEVTQPCFAAAMPTST